MNASASIQNSSTSGHCTPRRQYAQNTSREKRTCSVSVGVNAVKSWVPTRAQAHDDNNPRSTRWGQYSARPGSSALGAARASTR